MREYSVEGHRFYCSAPLGTGLCTLRTERLRRTCQSFRPDNTAIQKLLPNESICSPPPLCAGPTKSEGHESAKSRGGWSTPVAGWR